MGVHSENKSNTTTVELDQGELDTSMISFDLVLNVTEKYLLILSIITSWSDLYAGDVDNTEFRQACSIAILTVANMFITNGVYFRSRNKNSNENKS
jgi:hypothetical protein